MTTERGLYAQGWIARGYNYHPSLPPRRLKMTEDFAEYRATIMTWPSLGGGSISLAYLEDEALAPIPARLRQYGFLKDSEFLDEARKRGVKAFSVIFSTLAHHPLDVVMIHDGVHRDDDAEVESLQRYKRVILPGCGALTARQAEVLLGFLDRGGMITVLGELGGQDGVDVTDIQSHPRTTAAESADALALVPDDPQERPVHAIAEDARFQLPNSARIRSSS